MTIILAFNSLRGAVYDFKLVSRMLRGTCKRIKISLWPFVVPGSNVCISEANEKCTSKQSEYN